MKLLLKILLFLLTIFCVKISEAKNIVFDIAVSKVKFVSDATENKTESIQILETDFGIRCKSENKIVNYRNCLLASKATAAKGGGKYLYHYTSKEAAQSISQQGLKVGRVGFSYLTNKGNLSPLQAQIELALPANRVLPSSILPIDASGLNPALIRRVSGNLPGYGAGGGTEFLFNQHIPANLYGK